MDGYIGLSLGSKERFASPGRFKTASQHKKRGRYFGQELFRKKDPLSRNTLCLWATRVRQRGARE